MRLLLVEDDSIISKNIMIFLKRKGYSVDLSESIEDAYDKSTTEDYDLIILDRGLPDGDGLTLIKKIRDEDVHIPILVLTARNEDIDIIEGLNLGADDYLSKPFDLEILIARIKALTRRLNKIPLKPILEIKDTIDSQLFTQAFSAVQSGQASANSINIALEQALETGKPLTDFYTAQTSDTAAIEKMAEDIISNNPKAVEDYKKNPNSIGFLLGQVIKASAGSANHAVAKQVLEKLLK